MDNVAQLPLGGRRWQRYGKTFRFTGVDLTNATLQLQVRLYANAPGAPLINLVNVTNGNAEGLRLSYGGTATWAEHVAAKRLPAADVPAGTDMTAQVALSVVGMAINELTMEGMPFQGEVGQDSIFAYDMQVTPVGGYKQVWVEGQFWVLAAVTGADGAATIGTGGNGERRQRPSFNPGGSTFQIGDSTVVLHLGPSSGPQGDKGDRGDTGSGGGGGISDGVALHDYPGTTVEEDPNRWDHSNVQLRNALLDTTTPGSPNYGKWVDIHGWMGEGKRHADEWTGPGPNAIPTATDRVSGKPILRKFLAQDGDTLIDCWSQNGRYEVADFPTAHDKGALPGNLVSGARIRLLPGARVRRAPRLTGVPYPEDILRPLVLCIDPNPTAETTDADGIDTQSDVGRNIAIVFIGDSGIISENHKWGYREHHNDISLNGVTDTYVQTKHYGTLSDCVYIGAGNIGGGDFNRHNKNVEVHILADGRNQLNRNALSVIDCVGLRGTVRASNFTKGGGAGNNPFDPNSGTLNPGVVDIEPNTFTNDPLIDDIEIDVYAENCGSSAVATLLIDNNTIPHPLGSIRITGRAVACTHGKHTLIGAVNMAVPYQIHIRMDAIDCGSPFEVLTGQGCTHEGGRNLRSFRAGQIGYTGFASPQDFNRINEIDQELGSGDSAAIQVRGWNGGRISGGQMINGKTTGYEFLSNGAPGGSPIRDLIIEANEFVNRPNITSQLMSSAFYVNPSNGGPQIFPSTITERDVRYNGIANNQWAVAGSRVKNIPGFGVWEQGQEVFADPLLEPGAPRVMRTFASNTSGAPFWYQQELIQPVPDPSPFGNSATVTGFSTFNMRVESLGGGMVRLTAIGPNARWIWGSAVANFTIHTHAPFSGTTNAYVGGFTISTPSGAPSASNRQLIFGHWFYDPTGGALGKAIGILSAEPSGVLLGNKYGDRYQATYASGAASAVRKLKADNSIDSTLLATGTNTQNLYPGVLMLTPGESLIVRGVNI